MKGTFHNIKRHKPVKRVVLALFFISIDRIYLNNIYTVFIILYDRRIFHLEPPSLALFLCKQELAMEKSN